MSSVYNKVDIIDDTKEPSILMGLCEESLKYVDDVEPRYYFDETVSEDDIYKCFNYLNL